MVAPSRRRQPVDLLQDSGFRRAASGERVKKDAPPVRGGEFNQARRGLCCKRSADAPKRARHTADRRPDNKRAVRGRKNPMPRVEALRIDVFWRAVVFDARFFRALIPL